ncbi:MAG: GntR family transcriptional regulator [Bacteroidaceae bacterium]|nr:GntR family transcriptional regulator [Bacteroidaceae bacterium]
MRIALGNYNTLTIVRFTDYGVVLCGGEVGDILMPKAYVTQEMQIGQEVTAFVYLDQQERLVATREKPLVKVGECAFLECKWVNEHGAFLDWGLMKDLFVPYREQRQTMEIGESYLVYVYIDHETSRIVASAKLQKHLRQASERDFQRGEQVELILWHKTPLGFKVIVNHRYQGLIYDDQIFQPLHAGDKLLGTITNIRADGKLDVIVGTAGKERFIDFAQTLLHALQASADGFLPYGDWSTPEEIASTFNVSKKTFKRALGTLYRQHLLKIETDGVRLVRNV